jgi:hypothetical protein
MIALILGTLLAVGALAFVLYPIFFGVPTMAPPPPISREIEAEDDDGVMALREIEFDRATGKLSDADYAELKARYTRVAILAMRREREVVDTPAEAGSASDEEIEAAVRAYRERGTSCSTCGPRPEADAAYCSTCGRYLHDRCADCGAPVEALDARYCVRCGNRLAA